MQLIFGPVSWLRRWRHFPKCDGLSSVGREGPHGLRRENQLRQDELWPSQPARACAHASMHTNANKSNKEIGNYYI